MTQTNIKIQIPQGELTFRASRSAGPGGQNVNKLNTKITLFFNVAQSSYLSDWQKRRIAEKLAGRISSDGSIIIVSQRNRSQLANRIDAMEKLNLLLTNALKTNRSRKKTRPSRASIERRLVTKKKRGFLKKQRGAKIDMQ
ncbi:MAG: aminoacyl-tRNA hydrolase [Anaerohalosphaeraceae bacterium]|nr:aminoacyl-tRNA hydrolase [Anaerohalosphaeraceae bacterium]